MQTPSTGLRHPSLEEGAGKRVFGVCILGTHRAPPDLFTPLKGHSFISAQLSTDAVSALRKVRVLIKLQALVYDILPWTKMLEDGARSVDDCRNYLAPKHARKHEAHPPRVKKRIRPYSNDLGFILAGKQHSQY